MKDAEFDGIKKRVDKLVGWWKDELGLTAWTISVKYCRAGLEDADINAQIKCEWEYMNGFIEVNCPNVLLMDDREIEDVIVHELTHFLVAEMAEKDESGKHEERVVTQLTNAFLRLRDTTEKVTEARVRKAIAKAGRESAGSARGVATNNGNAKKAAKGGGKTAGRSRRRSPKKKPKR